MILTADMRGTGTTLLSLLALLYRLTVLFTLLVSLFNCGGDEAEKEVG